MQPEMGVMFRREQHPSTLIAYAQRVEAMGFDQLWVVEDCFYAGGIAQATMALTATTRLKVGMGINPAVARNPAFLAMEYATLANAFPGRFIGGIGHGVSEWMQQIGSKPASWLTSIEETSSSVRRILRGESVSVDGRYVHLDAVQLEMAPEIVPPVLLGVRGEKSLRLAGTSADGILVVEFSGPAYVHWARDVMNAGRAEAGQAGPGRVIVYANTLVDDDAPTTARETVREMIATSYKTAILPTLAPMSFAAEIAAIHDAGGAAALCVEMPDEWIDELSITGSHADAKASVARFVGAGAEAVILVPPEDADWDSWLGMQVWANATE